ncbi:tRNA selenocysteine 1-associated protein 1-like isoform X2 [Physella acuta]|uniref:tRNA selenocysteine 1-associated protein 1-like isoform X2 n=1 Tax=Physella acuta TaxID=109671 RepID=UPI0027DEA8C8|nr:tRNA selenocysteine 1-associated protein 1-like isoform X2 [Physella acuta]
MAVLPRLDDDFDEQSIINAFAQLGEVVVNIKMMSDVKDSGSLKPGNYCFIEFPDVDCAQRVLHRLNGKYIPGKTGKRFKLNPASFGREHELLPEFSLYVGDLSWNIDDYDLFSFFQKRYKSVRGAKVVMDQSGKSKGFGFIRFSEESDQQRALIEMQHMTGLGRRPIKVSLASIKKPNDSPSLIPPPVALPSHNSYYAGHYSWGGYGYHYNQPYSQSSMEYGANPGGYEGCNTALEDDSEVLEDPELEINVGKENREFIESSESFFASLEQSRWQPLDNIMSEVPD